MREWTSIDGKTIRAEMLGFEGDGVRLRLDGGQRTLVPVARLSPQDRAEIVRVRFRDDYRFVPGEAAKTNYYYSRLTPQDGGHKGIVALISVGPGRFLFELKIHSDTLDLRTYDRIEISANAAAPVLYPYEPGQVVSFGTAPTVTSRVILQLAAEDSRGLLECLEEGLADGVKIEISASRGGKDRVSFPMDETARAALADLLAVFLEARPLLAVGVIRREPLADQIFAAQAAEPVPPTEPASTNSLPNFSAEETAELNRMSSGRGSGRFGDITWTPPGETVRSVRGFGWIRDLVVIREAEGPAKLVPFSEIGESDRGKLLSERLADFSGNRPPSAPQGILYFPEDWTDHQRKTSQGLVFGRDPANGKPILIAQGFANKFKGAFITELAIRGEAIQGFVALPVEARANRVENAGGDVWTYASIEVNRQQSAELAKLAGVQALDLRISSGEDSLTFPLKDTHLLVSLEALRCYRWAVQVP